jgi:hypothetical protein
VVPSTTRELEVSRPGEAQRSWSFRMIPAIAPNSRARLFCEPIVEPGRFVSMSFIYIHLQGATVSLMTSSLYREHKRGSAPARAKNKGKAREMAVSESGEAVSDGSCRSRKSKWVAIAAAVVCTPWQRRRIHRGVLLTTRIC